MIQRPISFSRLAPVLALSVVAAMATACSGFIEHSASQTTTKILSRAQPSIKQESDYLLARAAIPGSLKTLEGFWIADPNDTLRAILTEGYCQYGIGFVEDDWEVDLINKDFDKAAEDEAHATKMFLRCMNYALMSLGRKWQDGLFGKTEEVEALVKGAGSGQRTPLMWAAIGLGSMINHNKDNVELVAQAPTAEAMLLKVVEIDAKHPPRDPVLAALPHLALGLLYTAGGTQLGGDAKLATEHFMKALEVTDGKFLLARVNYARKLGVMIQDRKLFHDELVKVLQTDPAIWPEQRLANEIAHRRARRYLSQEKELF